VALLRWGRCRGEEENLKKAPKEGTHGKPPAAGAKEPGWTNVSRSQFQDEQVSERAEEGRDAPFQEVLPHARGESPCMRQV